jgi:hypothetical protein
LLDFPQRRTPQFTALGLTERVQPVLDGESPQIKGKFICLTSKEVVIDDVLVEVLRGMRQLAEDFVAQVEIGKLTQPELGPAARLIYPFV